MGQGSPGGGAVESGLLVYLAMLGEAHWRIEVLASCTNLRSVSETSNSLSYIYISFTWSGAHLKILKVDEPHKAFRPISCMSYVLEDLIFYRATWNRVHLAVLLTTPRLSVQP